MTSGGHKNVRNGLGIGLLGGAGVCALGYCALSAGLIPSPASPILVPIGIGIVVGSGILGAVAGEIFPKNNTSQTSRSSSSSRIVPNDHVHSRFKYGPDSRSGSFLDLCCGSRIR